ncbi:exo-alpha-sialidase [Trypanosoma cruzi]|nr:exo-alpha-sialidase [Trypanosoma cruzi]
MSLCRLCCWHASISSSFFPASNTDGPRRRLFVFPLCDGTGVTGRRPADCTRRGADGVRRASLVSVGRHPPRPAARRSAIPSRRREAKDRAVDLDAPVPLVAAVCVCVCSGCPNPLAPQMQQQKDVVAWRRQCHWNQTVPVAHTQTGRGREGIFAWAADRTTNLSIQIEYDGREE